VADHIDAYPAHAWISAEQSAEIRTGLRDPARLAGSTVTVPVCAAVAAPRTGA
jgi:hypothetical protein